MENMEKHFGEQLAKYEVAPPADLWHKISDKLDHSEVLADVNPKAKTVWFTRQRMLRVAAAAVLLIGVETTIHFYFKDDETQTAATSVKTSETTTPQENTATEAAITEPTVVKTTVAQVEKTVNNKFEKTANNAEIPSVQEAVAHEEIIVAPVPQIAVVETKEEQVASTTVAKENNNSTSVSSNAVPVYSLRLLDKDVPANDEITVIDPKAKKVIIIEKGIDKPKIDYNTPKRF